MTIAESILDSHPGNVTVDRSLIAKLISSCAECAETCTMCADACLGEEQISQLRRCIRLNLDCADVCSATVRLLGRQTETEWGVVRAQVEACSKAVKACGDSCEKQAGAHEHCRLCMESCRRCEEACNAFLAAI